MRIKTLLSLIFILSVFSLKAQDKDLIETIAKKLKAANSRELANHFSSTLSISVDDEESEYSRAQSELIIRDFLSKNKPVSLKELHRITSNPGYIIAVFSMKTQSDVFRILVYLSDEGSKFLIKEIRIEDEKE